MSCAYYTFQDGDYHCVKQGKDVSSDIYWKFCRNYDYSDCPIYKSESSSSGCFLTSACTAARGLPDDCRELQTLRRFRDKWLKHQPDGVTLIAHYYEVAPRIVDVIDTLENRLDVYDDLYRNLVIPCVEMIDAEHYVAALNLYQDTVLAYERRYI